MRTGYLTQRALTHMFAKKMDQWDQCECNEHSYQYLYEREQDHGVNRALGAEQTAKGTLALKS